RPRGAVGLAGRAAVLRHQRLLYRRRGGLGPAAPGERAGILLAPLPPHLPPLLVLSAADRGGRRPDRGPAVARVAGGQPAAPPPPARPDRLAVARRPDPDGNLAVSPRRRGRGAFRDPRLEPVLRGAVLRGVGAHPAAGAAAVVSGDRFAVGR